MPEVTNQVTMKGNTISLVGSWPEVGTSAPNCTLKANDLSDFELSSLKGKKVILSIVPSLDTPVCDLQTKRFNQEATNLGEDVAVVTVSMDLPFAQKRWCADTGSDQVITLSDFNTADFGQAYGVLIDGLRLLARAIFVVDANGDVQYRQIVGEVTDEPNYDEVIDAIKKL